MLEPPKTEAGEVLAKPDRNDRERCTGPGSEPSVARRYHSKRDVDHG